MTETLKYLLSEFKPDEEFFYNDDPSRFAELLSNEDWEIITNKRAEFDDELKRAFLHIAGYASLNNTHDFMVQMLYEWETGLIMRSLFSIHQSYKNELETAKLQLRIPFQFHPGEIEKIISSCVNFAVLSQRDPEFAELISMLEH